VRSLQSRFFGLSWNHSATPSGPSPGEENTFCLSTVDLVALIISPFWRCYAGTLEEEAAEGPHFFTSLAEFTLEDILLIGNVTFIMVSILSGLGSFLYILTSFLKGRPKDVPFPLNRFPLPPPLNFLCWLGWDQVLPLFSFHPLFEL